MYNNIMSLLRKKSPWQTIFRSRFTIALLAFVAFLLSFSVYDRYKIKVDTEARKSAKEEELRELENRKAVLEKKVEYLSGKEGAEAEIRKHFDVAKEGEQIVVLIDERSDDSNSHTSTSYFKDVEGSGFWSNLIPWYNPGN
jgi:cell division protein FtsB